MAMLLPLFDAPIAVQIHVGCAALSVLLAPLQIWRWARGVWHRRLGYLWIGAMFVTAVSSFWITDIRLMGPFSPIHLLSVMTIFGLWSGLRAVWQRDFVGHAVAMRGLSFWALGIAGILTLLPGRIMHQILLSPLDGAQAVSVIVAMVAALFGLSRLGQGRAANKKQNP